MTSIPAPSVTAPVVLGYAPMDEVHAEFQALLGRAASCPDEDFPLQLDAVVAHLREHFEAEDRWMAETDFPPGDCHRDEHAAVLRSADEVQLLHPDSRLVVGRAFVRELAHWFPGHADYLDSALAAWMCRRAHGGKPVVLLRRVPTSAAEQA